MTRNILPDLFMASDEVLPEYIGNVCDEFNVQINIASEIPEICFLLSNGNMIFQLNTETQISFNLVKSYLKIKYQKNSTGLGPLIKAVGKGTKSVMDITCGSGVDSMYLLAAGLEVYAYERNPVVAFLLSSSLAYYRSLDDDFSEVLKHFHFVFADPKTLDTLPEVDAYYYDPMYPEKKKSSAKSRKDMEAFKIVVGEDTDEYDVLVSLLKNKEKRVIVKRPANADPIIAKPTASFTGKTTRYDLYKNFKT